MSEITHSNTEGAEEMHPSARRWSALIAALDEMETQSRADHPDQTVQWALNELSDEGHAYLFSSCRRVLDAYKAWKLSKR